MGSRKLLAIFAYFTLAIQTLHAQQINTWKQKYVDAFHLTNYASKHTSEFLDLRIWIRHSQVIQVITSKNKTFIYLVSYANKVDADNNLLKIVFKKQRITTANTAVFDTIQSLLPVLRNIAIEYENKYASARYEVEIKSKGTYITSLVAEDARNYPRALHAMQWVEANLHVSEHYKQFFYALPAGNYFNGKVIITKR